jgi:hypothetical protein
MASSPPWGDASLNDGWRDTKDTAEDPDWMYEVRIPPQDGVGIALKPEFRRLPVEFIERIRAERNQRIDAGKAAWAIMTPFNERTRCVKCGNDRATSAFVSAHELHFDNHEVIARQCERCRFVWHERPIDAEANS